MRHRDSVALPLQNGMPLTGRTRTTRAHGLTVLFLEAPLSSAAYWPAVTVQETTKNTHSQTLVCLQHTPSNHMHLRQCHTPPPFVLPHPREDHPPPPPGGRLPSDGPPSPPPTPGEPYYHRTRTISGTEIAPQNERIQWQDCLAFTLIRDASPCSESPTTCAKIGSSTPVEWMNIAFVPGVNMAVLSSSISAKVSKMSCQGYKGYKWQCLTTQSPTQQHSEP